MIWIISHAIAASVGAIAYAVLTQWWINKLTDKGVPYWDNNEWATQGSTVEVLDNEGNNT